LHDVGEELLDAVFFGLVLLADDWVFVLFLLHCLALGLQALLFLFLDRLVQGVLLLQLKSRPLLI
jgi:hypothetical protein